MRHLVRATVLLVVATVAACSPARPGATGPNSSRVAGPAPTSVVAAPTPAAAAADTDDLPSRVVIPALHIDLPVVSGDFTVKGNPADYPLCDVAQYLTTYRFPGHDGFTTWIYGHAREGMFLPILDASTRNNGASLIGADVQVYSTALKRYTYRITGVRRHAVDRSIAAGVPAGERRLVLQTSEGPHGTVPKLQVSADLVETAAASGSDAVPTPQPRGCAG